MDTQTICEKRKAVYQLLSYLLLNEPSEQVLRSLENNKLLLREIANDELLFTKTLDNKSTDSIKQEYYDRFFVTSSKTYVPPYEYPIRNRVHTERGINYGRLNCVQSGHVSDCYAAVGFKPATLSMFEPLREMQYSDHLAYEVAFMAYLLTNEERSFLNGDEVTAKQWQNRQLQFLEEHLVNWVDDFIQLAEEKAPGLYIDILKVITKWIDNDFNYMLSTNSH